MLVLVFMFCFGALADSQVGASLESLDFAPRGGATAVQVVDVETGLEAWSYGDDRTMVPASVMKVLTAATGLRALGTSYRFSTEFYTTGVVDAEGTLQGDLVVVGGGDPSMVVERLWKVVADIGLHGISRIEGNVILDDAKLDRRHLIEGWRKSTDLANGPAYFAPIGALTVNFNAAAVIIRPGANAGDPAHVQLETPSGLVSLTHEIETGPKRSRPWLRIEREVRGAKMDLHLEGKIAQDADLRRLYKAVPDPTAYFGSVLRALMAQQQLDVSGDFVVGSKPDDAVHLFTHDSPRLSSIVADMNKYSSNVMAEHLLKVIGAEVHGFPGTTENGLIEMRKYLDEIGLDTSEMNLVNGSGLARDIQLRPSDITAVLVNMAHDRIVGPEFVSSLASGGVDGTLYRRFDDDDEAGRVRGKTGSLDGVHCLAGYAEAKDGRLYAFAFFANGHRSGRTVRTLQDGVVRTLLQDQTTVIAGATVPSVEAEGTR